MTEKYLPVIGITMGDPAGIGPEIVVKALSDTGLYQQCRPLVVGDAGVIRQALSFTGINLNLRTVSQAQNESYEYGTINIYDLSNVTMPLLIHGKVDAMAGKAAFEAIRKAIELAMNKEIDATVTGPIHKESINLAGYRFSGHTEIYAHFTETKKYAMLLVHNNMRVIHVSTHVSLKQACDLVKKERIMEVISLLDSACRQFGIREPRIGVAGLNPHASDNGLFGNEERDEILPAVEESRESGYKVEGPVPADTLFAKAKGGLYDGCVAMYHDQGHIPFKMEGFSWDTKNKRMESVQGINITLGLPIIRTSVDHGTAFEIAGRGIASPDALIQAIEYAIKMITKD